jgi:hypothetical protein
VYIRSTNAAPSWCEANLAFVKDIFDWDVFEADVFVSVIANGFHFLVETTHQLSRTILVDQHFVVLVLPLNAEMEKTRKEGVQTWN